MSDNLWVEFLKEAASGDSGGSDLSKSTLYVVGNAQNGKSSIMKNWKDRVTSDTNIPEYILDYSYCNVVDRFDPDTADDALVSRMGIWQLDDDAHANLLPTLTKDAASVGFVITLDLSEPQNIMESFEKWLKVYENTCKGLVCGGSAQEKDLKLKISKYVQTFVDATKKIEKPVIEIVEQAYDPDAEKAEDGEAKPEDGEAKPEDGEAKDGEAKPEDGEAKADEGDAEEEVVEKEEEIFIETPIDPDVPEKNFGIPLFVVGLKADYFEKGLNQIGATDKFDFLTNKLRTECIKWGATLIYTSAVGDGVNASLLVDQIYHRMFNFPLAHKPKVVGSSTDYAIHVPAGYDKLSLIQLSRKAKWDDSTHLSVVFGVDTKGQVEKKKASAISAKSDPEFFASLKEQLDSGIKRVDPTANKEKNKRKKEKAVKSFFKSLLSKE